MSKKHLESILDFQSGGTILTHWSSKRGSKISDSLHYRPFKASEIFHPTYEVLKMKDSDMTKQNGESPSRCDQCVFSSPDIGIMMKHLTTHLKETLNKCGHCEKTFSGSIALKSHLKMRHGKRQHQCCHCGFAFPRPESLRTHLKLHAGEKPLKCDQCD